MNILDIIAKKRDGKKLSKEEIDFFVQGYTNNSISDYQAAALIMAIYINKLDDSFTQNTSLNDNEYPYLMDSAVSIDIDTPFDLSRIPKDMLEI